MDTLTVSGMTRLAPGGAAFITALAARAAGAPVGLVARVPSTLPAIVAMAFGPQGIHRGGLICSEGRLPSFRINYDESHRATYQVIEPGMESNLTGDDVPAPWLKADWIHVAAIGGDARQQLRVAERLRARGFTGRLSAGTFRRMVEEQPKTCRLLMRLSDLFFLNEEEFGLLLPDGIPPDHRGTIVVTRGADGVQVHGGEHAGLHPAAAAHVVDATGAGDAMCGGFLGGLITGKDPVSTGQEHAQQVLSDLGANALLRTVRLGITPRAEVDELRTSAVAKRLGQVASLSALDFSDPPHLPPGHPQALPMLWISTLHQYGFWHADVDRWQGPMLAQLDGQLYKGSDFIWAAFSRAAREDASLLSPQRMAKEPSLFSQICTADDGSCPVPDLPSHEALHQAHGMAMLSTDYPSLLQAANQSPKPGAALLRLLQTQPGYQGDPLQKKANLLLLILSRRPEGFLDLKDPESVAPIVDYHLMRGCLRTGCVRILDPDLAYRLEHRMWVDAPEELAIRQACGRAIQDLVIQSGTSVAAVDGFFFVNGRRVCRETIEADCPACPIAPACAQETSMFQPVFRTTAY